MEKMKRAESFSFKRVHKWTRRTDSHILSFYSVFSGAKTVYTLEIAMHLMGLILYVALLLKWFGLFSSVAEVNTKYQIALATNKV